MSAQSSLNTSVAAAAPAIHPLIGQLVTVVGGVVTAWATLHGRFLRVKKLRTDCDAVERSFYLFYVLPQVLNALVFAIIVMIAGVAVAGGLMSNAVPQLHLGGGDTSFGQFAINAYRLGWGIFLAGFAAGAVAYFDLLTWIFLWAARLGSLFRLPYLAGRFGPGRTSLGWLQAREFALAGKDALPLTISPDGIDRVVAPVHHLLATTGAGGKDRAPEPPGSSAARANIALFACIIEQSESDLHLPRRAMDIFYAAFGTIHRDANFFEPSELDALADGRSFSARLQELINPVLTTYGQAVLPTDLAAQQAVEGAFGRLKKQFRCDTTRMATHRRLPFESPADALLRRGTKFPKLDNDRMGPQFVKLCLRWRTVPFTEGTTFVPSFADRIAWRLLEAGAVQPLADVKDVPLRGTMNRPAFRIAESRVIAAIRDRFATAPDSDAPNLLPRLRALPDAEMIWMIEQETDTALWRDSAAKHDAASNGEWKGCRWKLDNNVARRL